MKGGRCFCHLGPWPLTRDVDPWTLLSGAQPPIFCPQVVWVIVGPGLISSVQRQARGNGP